MKKLRHILLIALVTFSTSIAFSRDQANVAFANEASKNSAFGERPIKTMLTEPQDFDRGTLMAPEYRSNSVSGFSLINPNRFAMRQSYSVNVASGGLGTSSAGLYLNTISYKIADPLTLSADVGFYTPLYSSNGNFSGGNFSRGGLKDPRAHSSLVLPHVGLEYRPTKNTSFSLHLLNGQDAYKAYGSRMDPFISPWSR